MPLSGQTVLGTCCGFLKNLTFKESGWTNVFTGVNQQLMRRVHRTGDLDLELKTSGSFYLDLLC